MTNRTYKDDSPQDATNIISTEELINHFYRFSLVLTFLKKLSAVKRDSDAGGRDPDAVTGFRRAFEGDDLASLFGKSGIENKKFLTKSFWKQNFEGRQSRSATVYDCRNFYATDSPNNLQERFKKIIANAQQPSSSKSGRPSVSQHDDHIRDWGGFAENLVKLNGGWLKFLAKDSLEDVSDIWKSGQNSNSGWKLSGLKGNDHDSFIQRILCLASDRYVQILASTVAPMWALWFLKDAGRRQTLKKILERQNKNFHIGRSLPNNEIFIDVNIKPGSFKDFPFPFGYADKALTLDKDFSEERGIDEPSWSSREINVVANSLVSLNWCPPLLFGGRGDQWVQPHDPFQNLTIPYISLGSHTKFGAVYLRNDAAKKLAKKSNKANALESLRIAFEPKTWGDFALNKIRNLKHLNLEKTRSYDRPKMLSDFKDAETDLVLSYFPLDAFLNVNAENFTQLEPKDIYRYFDDCGEHLIYDLPSTILAGGAFLSRQPKMSVLIEYLARYLYKVEAIFRHLLPAWENSDVPHLLRQAASKDLTERRAAAKILSILCRNSVQSSNIYKDRETLENAQLKPEQIETWAKDMSYEMAASVARNDESKRHLKEIFDDWQWILILPSIRNMQVFISCDLFSTERGQNHEA